MKRSKPRKPIRRKSWLRSSRRPIAPRRADPTRRAFAKRRVPAFQAFIREHLCAVSRKWLGRVIPGMCSGRIECAHLKTRATGGDDVGNCIPLCRGHHQAQHTLGIRSFQNLYGVNLRQIATDLTEIWLRTADGLAWRDAHPTDAS